MRADQKIIVGGTLNGKRIVSEVLSANDSMYRYYSMRSEGYLQLTMTDAETGEEYDVGKFLSESPKTKQ